MPNQTNVYSITTTVSSGGTTYTTILTYTDDSGDKVQVSSTSYAIYEAAVKIQDAWRKEDDIAFDYVIETGSDGVMTLSQITFTVKKPGS